MVTGQVRDKAIALILVEADSAIYIKNNKPQPVTLREVLKPMVSGNRPMWSKFVTSAAAN